ncbi:MAG TPA: trigger factor [Candidatus Paceibacterota bacterium]|nr:trigger factor [Candidatus Paceibacterota bacterium]
MSTTNVTIKRDDKAWEVDVSAEIPVESLEKYRVETLAELQKTTKLDGFRPGKVPTERIAEMYGEDTILRLAAERAIQAELPELLAKEELLIIEAPKVTTDSPASGKALSFTARAGLAPKVELADYVALAKGHTDKKEMVAVTDKERQDAMLHLRRERARIDKIENGTDAQKAAEEARAMAEGDLPALDDAFAQSIGYDDAAAFEKTLSTNMQNEKEIQAAQKRRGAILDELVRESKISYPAVLKHYELDDIEARFAEDIGRAGATMERYLAEIKKTTEELRTSWEAAAESRVKVRLILAEIARKEHIEPAPDVVEHELDHAIEHYPKADRDALRANVIHALRNEMALRFLEGNPDPVGHASHDH